MSQIEKRDALVTMYACAKQYLEGRIAATKGVKDLECLHTKYQEELKAIKRLHEDLFWHIHEGRV